MPDFNQPAPVPEPCKLTPTIEPAVNRWDKEYIDDVISPHMRATNCSTCNAECVRMDKIIQSKLPPPWLRTASQVSSVMLMGFHLLMRGGRR